MRIIRTCLLLPLYRRGASPVSLYILRIIYCTRKIIGVELSQMQVHFRQWIYEADALQYELAGPGNYYSNKNYIINENLQKNLDSIRFEELNIVRNN